MAKGRRLTTSLSERLLGVGDYRQYFGHVLDNMNVSEISEYEEDIWLMVENTSAHQHRVGYGGDGSEWTPRTTLASGTRQDVASRQDKQHVGGLSLAFDEGGTTLPRRIIHQFGTANKGTNSVSEGPLRWRQMATSAPVNVPDWSKIFKVDSGGFVPDPDKVDRVEDSGMEPPHEYLARSRRMNAFSVYEGVGRTLKGRDMSRVRNAVWSQTGFEG